MKRLATALVFCLMVLLFTGCQGESGTPSRATTSTTTVFHTTVTKSTLSRPTLSGTDATSSTTSESSTASSTTSTTVSSSSGTVTSSSTKTTTMSSSVATTTNSSSVVLPTEVRGAWVSYFELESLFKSCTTVQQTKNALDGLFQLLQNNRINVVYFHVRANSDAYYDSQYFKATASTKSLLDQGFDPLTYAVETAHKRGMQLHAWVNPYRAGKNTAYLVSDVPTFQDSAGRYYYVPTSSKTQQLVLNGIRELVNNYDIDGIQYDDYFYPKGVLQESTPADFETSDYNAVNGTMSVGDWRRAAVNRLIAGTHTITSQKGKIFGVSPAYSAQDTYDHLYADVKLWLSQSGYVDYLCPQLYFGFDHATAAFDDLVTTWMGYTRHASVQLHVGLALYKIGLKSDTYAGTLGKTEWAKHNDVMKRSVEYLRSKNISGIAFYSATYFDPASCGSTFAAEHDVTVAKQEIQNLLTVL